VDQFLSWLCRNHVVSHVDECRFKSSFVVSFDGRCRFNEESVQSFIIDIKVPFYMSSSFDLMSCLLYTRDSSES
jgi:hypothetical protein